MNKEQLTLEIAERLQEIKDLYLREYPDGDYLSLVIYKDSIGFNNRSWEGGEDEDYPIDYHHFDSKGEIE